MNVCASAMQMFARTNPRQKQHHKNSILILIIIIKSYHGSELYKEIDFDVLLLLNYL